MCIDDTLVASETGAVCCKCNCRMIDSAHFTAPSPPDFLSGEKCGLARPGIQEFQRDLDTGLRRYDDSHE